MTDLATSPQSSARAYRAPAFARVVAEGDGVRSLLKRWMDTSDPQLLLGPSAGLISDAFRVLELTAELFTVSGGPKSFSPNPGSMVVFSFESRAQLFFASRFRRRVGDALEFDLPDSLFGRERRREERRVGSTRLRVASGDVDAIGSLLDESPGGVGVLIGGTPQIEVGERLRISLGARRLFGEVRSLGVAQGARTGTRLGIATSLRARCSRVPVVRAKNPGPSIRGARFGMRLRHVSSHVLGRQWGRHPSRSFVNFKNMEGERLVGLLDEYGPTLGAASVVLSPGWGGTKEALLPLADAIIARFSEIGQPIRVLRFDGTRRAGESYIPLEQRRAGSEYLGFRFSKAADDLRAALKFARQGTGAPRSAIVSTSLSAIESRVLLGKRDMEGVCGWVALVGTPDLQSALLSASGGVDYGSMIAHGQVVGCQELAGVRADIDATGYDASAARIATREDSRADVAALACPVTWICGSDDGWVEQYDVQDVLAFSRDARTEIVEVDSGHRLRTSSVAGEAFSIVAERLERMLLGGEGAGDIVATNSRRQSRFESRRRRPRRECLHDFWRGYLLGREGDGGISHLQGTDAYKELMRHQVAALSAAHGDRVADLGCGRGGALPAFEVAVRHGHELSVVGFDVVADGIRACGNQATRVGFAGCVADLEAGGGASLPVASSSFDRVLASLVLSYVERPSALLGEIFRILKPGGKLVVSSLTRDADLWGLWGDGVRASLATGAIGGAGGDPLQSGREFLSSAARLLSMEEAGRFQFWDDDELEDLLRFAGFARVVVTPSLGAPPQAVIVSAYRD